MKKLIILLAVVLGLGGSNANAQIFCPNFGAAFTGGAFQFFFPVVAPGNELWTDGVNEGIFLITPPVMVTGDVSIWQVTCGNLYVWSSCGLAGGNDVVMNLWDGNTGVFIDGDDDGCGFPPGESELFWVADRTGIVLLTLNNFPCGSAGTPYQLIVGCFDPLPPVAVNDQCEDAIQVGCGDVVSGSTVGTIGDAMPFCGVSDGAGGVWYSITGTGDKINASLCNNTNYDSKIRVWSGSCVDNCAEDLTCIDGDDDFCSFFGPSEVEWCSEDGVEYKILVHGFGPGDEGNFELAITCTPPPANDNICDAEKVEITCDGSTVANFNNDCATPDGNSPGPGSEPGNSCDSQDGWCDFETDVDNDVWFVFKPTKAGTLCIESDGFDTQLAVWCGKPKNCPSTTSTSSGSSSGSGSGSGSGSSGSSTSSTSSEDLPVDLSMLELVAANDDGGSGVLFSSKVGPLTIGKEPTTSTTSSSSGSSSGSNGGGGGAPATCDLELRMTDSFGDGWNGATMAVLVNGVPVPGSPFANTTIDPIQSITDVVSFTINDGDLVSLVFAGGAFDSEVSYELVDPNGTTITSGSNPPDGVVYVDVVNCPPPAPPDLIIGRTYYIQIDGFGGASGDGTLTLDHIAEDPAACAGSTSSSSASKGSGEEMVIENNQFVFKAFPNPFSTSTTINFSAAEDGNAVVEVFTTSGTSVGVIFNETVTAGQVNNIEFDGSDLPTGVYITRLSMGDDVRYEKISIVK